MLALIDGDVLCYLACRSRYTNKDGFVKIAGSEKPTFTMAEDAKYMEESWANFKRIVEECKEAVYAEEHLMAVKSEWNYRDLIYPIREENGKLVGYKAKRYKAPEDANVFVRTLRERAIETGLAIEAINREADDLVSIWGHQCKLADVPYTVITNDKDMAVIGGNFYNPKTLTKFKVTPEEGLRFFYKQLLMGDGVDDIPGIFGIGPKGAERLLEDCEDEDDMQFVILEQYKHKFGDEWRHNLLANGKLLYLQKYEDDFFTLGGWTT